MSQKNLWLRCQELLVSEIQEQQLNTWIRPLHAIEGEDQLNLLAPNRFVQDWVKQNFLNQIETLARKISNNDLLSVSISVGSSNQRKNKSSSNSATEELKIKPQKKIQNEINDKFEHSLNRLFTFDNYVGGKSNQLARAAAMQVAENPGSSYNPPIIYGGVG